MKSFALRIPPLALALVGMVLAGGCVASAQDLYKVNYFSNNQTAGAPDATVRIDNPGLTYGNLCANIYVFAADQQMAECCSCVQSHNNLTTFSVLNNLASNARTLTGEFTPNGVIKIVSSLPVGGVCDASSTYRPTANLRAWPRTFRIPSVEHFPLPKRNSRTRLWAPPSLLTCRHSAHSSTSWGAVSEFAVALAVQTSSGSAMIRGSQPA